jgi:hypothetical protein
LTDAKNVEIMILIDFQLAYLGTSFQSFTITSVLFLEDTGNTAAVLVEGGKDQDLE